MRKSLSFLTDWGKKCHKMCVIHFLAWKKIFLNRVGNDQEIKPVICLRNLTIYQLCRTLLFYIVQFVTINFHHVFSWKWKGADSISIFHSTEHNSFLISSLFLLQFLCFFFFIYVWRIQIIYYYLEFSSLFFQLWSVATNKLVLSFKHENKK